MRFVSLVILVLTLVAFGAVATRNFWKEKALSDEAVLPDQLTRTPNKVGSPTAAITVGPDWKTFKSKDQSFRFRYPANWQINETPSLREGKEQKGVYRIIVQSWTLTNFGPTEGANLPEGAVKMNFEIATEGRKALIDNLLDCSSNNTVECKNQVINGITYKKSISRSSTTGESLDLATIKEDKIYQIHISISSDQEKSGRGEIERIIETFEIIQSS